MANLSDQAVFKSIVDEIHAKVLSDFASDASITSAAVDIHLEYTRVAGTNNATVKVRATERRSNHARQVVGVVSTTT